MERITALRIISMLLLVYLNAFIASYTLEVKPMKLIRILGYVCVLLIHILDDTYAYACIIFSLPVTSLASQCMCYWSKNPFLRKFASETASDFFVDVAYVATLGVYIFAYHFRTCSQEAYVLVMDYVMNIYFKDLLLDVYKGGSQIYIALMCIAAQAIGVFYEGAKNGLLYFTIIFVFCRDLMFGWTGYRLTKVMLLSQALIGFRIFQYLNATYLAA